MKTFAFLVIGASCVIVSIVFGEVSLALGFHAHAWLTQ